MIERTFPSALQSLVTNQRCVSCNSSMEKKIVSLLEGVSCIKEMDQVHALITKTGLKECSSVACRMVSFCVVSVSGNLNYAVLVFEELAKPAPFVWNNMIRAYANSIFPIEAILLYNRMRSGNVKADSFTFPFVLKACARVSRSIEEGHKLVPLHKGAEAHCTIIQTGLELDPFVQNSLISMYSISGSIEAARLVFNRMTQKNIVSWNTMVMAYYRQKNIESANGLLKEMPIRNVVSWNTMIAAHVDSGDIKAAEMVFEEMPERDAASWNAIIAGYIKKKSYSRALELFDKMQGANVSPTDITLITLVGACAKLGAMEMGKKLHEYIEKNVGFEAEGIMGNALVDMYAKCGNLKAASLTFERMRMKHVTSWNAMIVGIEVHGHCKEAIELFSRMQSSGTKPDSVTFLGVLTARSYSGLVDEGCEYFRNMIEKYKIEPGIKHYGCMVDLLSRSGLLEEAHDVINRMPFEANTIIWRTLLGASKTHGNVELAEVAVENLGRLEPLKHGDYVLLSNIYAEAYRWDDVERVRKMMVEMGVLKPPGFSQIEMNG
ncbi:hypothetical protein AMTRI_Chr09g36290 [Amborella trichopoda]